MGWGQLLYNRIIYMYLRKMFAATCLCAWCELRYCFYEFTFIYSSSVALTISTIKYSIIKYLLKWNAIITQIKRKQIWKSYSLFWTGDTWKQFSRAPSSCQKFADQSNWGISNAVQWNAISSDWHVVCAVCQIPRGGKEIDSFEKKKELI